MVLKRSSYRVMDASTGPRVGRYVGALVRFAPDRYSCHGHFFSETGITPFCNIKNASVHLLKNIIDGTIHSATGDILLGFAVHSVKHRRGVGGSSATHNYLR